MFLKRFLDKERSQLQKMKEKEKNDARMMIASDPVKPFLLGLMDDLVRQGIYLTDEEKEGAKMMLKVLGKEIQIGTKLKQKQMK